MKTQKYKNNWFIGYIFSREIDGNIIPQKVQNLVIRDYAERMKINYILSATEYKMKGSYLMLNSLLKKKDKKFNGIIIYSLFMLKDYPDLKNIFLKLKLKKIKILCALEEIEIKNLNQKNLLKKIFYVRDKS